MPVDLLQIALEHHRTGRLTQAEAAYRELLAADPANVEASHWLGVLLLQAGQAVDAAPLLARAAESKPDDAAYQHNLAQAYLALHRPADAVTAFERAAALDPNHVETWLGLGTALLARRAEGDATAAVAAVERARSAGLDTADLHRQLGIAYTAAGRPDDAIAALTTATTKDREDPWVLYHLALAHRQKGNAKDVRKNLLKALEIYPGLAHAWFALGALDAEEGKLSQAVSLYRRAISAKADLLPAYHALASSLQRLGQHAEANEALRQAERAAGGPTRSGSVEDLQRKLTPEQSGMELHYALAALTRVVPPPAVPAAAVTNLFNKYADHFDEHLRDKLQYRIPEQLLDAVRAAGLPASAHMLDLGCGTGIVGQLLRPWVNTLTGVDLSPAMIDKARERGAYDRLEIGELVSFMRQHPHSFDLITTADVLIYIGDLMPTFEAAAQSLRPGGLFAYSVEAGGGERYDLQIKSRRYRHSKPYLQKLAAMYGFEEVSLSNVTARVEANQPVPSFLVVLRLPRDEP